MWYMGDIKTLPNLVIICLFICMFTYLCVVYFRNVDIRAQGHMYRGMCVPGARTQCSVSFFATLHLIFLRQDLSLNLEFKNLGE